MTDLAAALALDDLTPAQRDTLLSRIKEQIVSGDITDEQAAVLMEALPAHNTAIWKPLPHQVVPEGRFRGFLFRGGRGAGKTDSLSYNAVKHMKGPPCDPRVRGGHRVMAVSGSAGDGISALSRGPSGIPAHWPGTREKIGGGGTYLVTPTGVEIRIAGAFTPEDVERQRPGGNNCLLLADEVASWRKEEIWQHLMIGLRLGSRRMWIAATTPRNRPLYRKLHFDERIAHSHGTMYDNPHLTEEYIADTEYEFKGTRMWSQEIMGELLEDVPGALWTWDLIEACRAGTIAEKRRTVVGVDPSGSEDGDETGIIAAAIDPIDTVWIMEDASRSGPPSQRYEAVCMTAFRHNAGEIVYEKVAAASDNIGYAITMAWDRLANRGKLPRIPPKISGVSARGAKTDRMKPILAMYERGEIKHQPGLGELEAQMCSWEAECGWSPDRIDALVYTVRALTGKGGPITVVPPPTESAFLLR